MELALTVWRLLHSFSRGAWLATVCGLAYLAVCLGQGRGFRFSLANVWVKGRGFPIAAMAASLIILLFWQFYHTEWLPARRVFSVINQNDFSWRNRIAAWEGALQIVADHPYEGIGFERTEQLCNEYYLPFRVAEGGAIQMNDYLTLASILGVPAAACLFIYFWLSLTANPSLAQFTSRRGALLKRV